MPRALRGEGLGHTHGEFISLVSAQQDRKDFEQQAQRACSWHSAGWQMERPGRRLRASAITLSGLEFRPAWMGVASAIVRGYTFKPVGSHSGKSEVMRRSCNKLVPCRVRALRSRRRTGKYPRGAAATRAEETEKAQAEYQAKMAAALGGSPVRTPQVCLR